MKKLSVAKFGGGLLDRRGKNIPTILERIRELKSKDDLGPIIVFSALTGFTDELIRIGESYTQSKPVSAASVFETYQEIAENYARGKYLRPLLVELKKYEKQSNQAIGLVNKRFHGNAKAKLLSCGGELPTSVVMEYTMKANGLAACTIPKENWPVVTDDNFENATPLYEASKKRLGSLIAPLEQGEIISFAGFIGTTIDGLETILGRGGSDLTAVFISCLLRNRYQVETILFKDVPVQSADPQVVKKQKTEHVTSLTYNEAHKASLMGMTIVQASAISMARKFKQPIKVVPVREPQEYTVIESKSVTKETVKCVTGKSGCAILSINDEKSRSLEDSLRIWEGHNDFLDLGTESLETSERIRDFLFLDSTFLRKNEERLKGFDENLTIEYGVGVVTLIGDEMKNSSGIASTAIAAIPKINIKRGVFAPHTSQIILVVEEKNVEATVSAIHHKRNDMNKTARTLSSAI